MHCKRKRIRQYNGQKKKNKRTNNDLQNTTQQNVCQFKITNTNTCLIEEEFEDTKGVIRIRKSKDRQHNGKMKRDKKTNNDLQNNTHKTKDRVTRIPLKTGGELRCSGRVRNSCSTSGTRRVNAKRHWYQLIWRSCVMPVYVNHANNINKT